MIALHIRLWKIKLFYSSGRMIFVGERYYNLHRITLTILGLWPYQKPSLNSRIQTVFIFSTFFFFLFFQLTIFLTSSYDTEFIIKELTYIFPTLIYALNYNCFYFNINTFKKSLEHIKLDWKTMKDSNELKILKKYAHKCYLFALIVNIIAGLAMFIFIIIEFIPVILDAVAPLNESRPRNLKVPYELFIDEEQYYVLYVIFEVITVTVGIWSTITTCTFLVTIGGHSCATFKIASNLIQDTVTENTLQIVAPLRIYFMHQNICRAVYIHRRSIEIMGNVLNTVHVWYLPLLVLGVVSSSCIIFRLLNAIIRLNDLSELFVSIMLFWGHFVYMFMANFCGQAVIDHSAEMLTAVYNTLWYVAPLSIQKLLLLLLKSVKDFKLDIGGIFVASFEGFSTLVTSAISYFTVIYTMR